MTYRARVIIIIIVAVVLFLLLRDAGHAEGTTTTEPVPTSTIGSINGPADVGPTTTTDPTAPTTTYVEECLDIGNGDGTGQTSDSFQPCELPEVDPGTPPVTTTIPSNTAERLPATGNSTFGYIFLAACCLFAGMLLLKVRKRYLNV